MKPDITIALAGQEYQLSELEAIPSVNQLTAYTHLPDYAREALQFCHQWVQGEEVFIQHTSGSTGAPKPIQIYRKQMMASARMTVSALGLMPGDWALVGLSASYIAGKMMLVRALEAGLHLLVVPPSSNPLTGVRKPVDFTALVPLQLKTILDGKDEKQLMVINRMKAVIVGGGAVSTRLEHQVRQTLHCPVYSTYGMTETVSHIALRRLNGDGSTDYYQTLEGVQIQTDDRGCLMVRAEVTMQKWLVTNDVVEIEDGIRFRWLGRIDHVINSGGVKIHVEQLEERLERGIQLLGDDYLFFVAGLPDDKLGEAVTLFIQGDNPGKLILDQFSSWLENSIDKYLRPRKVCFAPQFVFTGSKKIDRNKSIRLAKSHEKHILR